MRRRLPPPRRSPTRPVGDTPSRPASPRMAASWWTRTASWPVRSRTNVRSHRPPNGSSTTFPSSTNNSARSATTCPRTTTASSPSWPKAISRVTREMAFGQLGELAVVVRGQVVADLAELFVDDGKVVDEPFGGRCDRTFVLDRTGQDAVRRHEDAAILGNAGRDGVSPTWRVSDRLGGGKGLRVLLQPLHAEELREDRLFELGLQANPPATATGRVPEGLVRFHLPLSARSEVAGNPSARADRSMARANQSMTPAAPSRESPATSVNQTSASTPAADRIARARRFTPASDIVSRSGTRAFSI